MKDSEIRPIAVGNAFYHLVARATIRSTSMEATKVLQPYELGFGVPHGSEAVVQSLI